MISLGARNAWVMALGLATVAAVAPPVRAQEPDFERLSRRAAPRDAFPVFHQPRMVPADRVNGLRDDDWVIGIEVNGQSKAYPVAVMGVHELGNDVCGGEPIAVSW